MTTYKNNVRLHSTNDGDTGRSQLYFHCSPEIQKEFDGKRVELKIVLEGSKRRRRADSKEGANK